MEKKFPILFADRLKKLFLVYSGLAVTGMLGVMILTVIYGFILVPFSEWQVRDWFWVILCLGIILFYLGGVVASFGVLGRLLVNHRLKLGPVSIREKQEILWSAMKESLCWPTFFKRNLQRQ